jgi:class 3 adenylate cyclase
MAICLVPAAARQMSKHGQLRLLGRDALSPRDVRPMEFGSEGNMEAPSLDRMLVAILAADVEGYSRFMERDEVGALKTAVGTPCHHR